MSGTPHPAFHPRGSPWLIAIVVTMATFMEVLDTTIVNVSLPYIAGSLSVSYDESTWTLTSYLVANGIVVPISGWLGRLIGRKRFFLLCIAMFTLFSFLCGIATSLSQLVVFRLMQGVFGGGLQPNQQSIILDTFEPQDRGKGFSMVAVAIIFAPIIGPTLGGWLTDSWSWRWVFLINVPIGIFAFVAVAQLVEDPPWVVRDRARLADIDYIGLGLITVGFGGLQFMLDRGQDLDWFGSSQIRIAALLSASCLGGAVAWLLMADKPVVNLRALADRNFAVASMVTFGIGLSLYSSNVVIPLMSQEWLGYTALLAGLLLSPGAALMFILIPVTARLVLPNIQTRYVIGFGFFMVGCASLWAQHLTPDIDFWTLAAFRAIQTVGFSFLFVPNSTIGYSTLPRPLVADATALYSMFRNIAGSVGISLVTAIAANRLETHRTHLVDHLGPLDMPYQTMLSQYVETLRSLGYAGEAARTAAMGLLNQTLNKQAAILAYMDVFAVSAIAAFVLVPLTLLFRPGIAGRRG
ncbi:MAG: DHA2 family efflux MFS transporter permease subunit [Acetobacteraceae bacterium]|nr:DHA2 family efflux MFS transporter permease subunit [Acetobacteraceae bacterium]